MKNLILRPALGLFLAGAALQAGPIVTVSTNATALATSLLGAGVTLSGSPTLTGANGQAGTFTGSAAQTNLIGFTSGVILSSGNVADASGNYASANSPSTTEGSAGSSVLSALIGNAATNDASILAFNFIPNASTVFFSYTFASAEYPNFVNSQFNDVFGFIVNGVNYATIPGTTTAVSINNVNTGTNSAYFNKYNGAGDTLPYGGETKVLTFTAPVNPNVVNTIILGIADTSDSVLDSAVFIQAGTLSTTAPSTTPEPTSAALMGLAIAGLGAWKLRRKA